MHFSATQMGDASFEKMKKQQKVSSNKKLTQYVNCVAKRITAAQPDQTQRLDVVLFDSEQVNGFTLSGCHIGVLHRFESVLKRILFIFSEKLSQNSRKRAVGRALSSVMNQLLKISTWHRKTV